SNRAERATRGADSGCRRVRKTAGRGPHRDRRGSARGGPRSRGRRPVTGPTLPEPTAGRVSVRAIRRRGRPPRRTPGTPEATAGIGRQGGPDRRGGTATGPGR